MRLRELLLLNTSQAKDEEERPMSESRRNHLTTGDPFSAGATRAMATAPGGAVNAGGIRGRGGGLFDGDAADGDDEGGDADDDDDKADRRERAEILHGPPDVPRFPVEIDRRKKSGDLKSVRPAAPATTNPTVAAFATRHRVLLYRF